MEEEKSTPKKDLTPLSTGESKIVQTSFQGNRNSNLGIVAHGKRLFISSLEGIKIFDVSDGKVSFSDIIVHPSFGVYLFERKTKGASTEGEQGKLYLVAGTNIITIYEVTNSAGAMGSFSVKKAVAFANHGEVLYVFTQTDLVVVDLTSLKRPKVVEEFPHGLDFSSLGEIVVDPRGSALYLTVINSETNPGVLVYDISKPLTPELKHGVKESMIPLSFSFVKDQKSEERMIAAVGCQFGLSFLDVTDPFKAFVLKRFKTVKKDQSCLVVEFSGMERKDSEHELLVLSSGRKNRFTKYSVSFPEVKEVQTPETPKSEEGEKSPKRVVLEKESQTKLPPGLQPWDFAVCEKVAYVTNSGQCDIQRIQF